LAQKSIESLPQERRLELLVRAVVDFGLYILSSDGRVVSWNPGASRMKGYEESEVIGRHFSLFYLPEDREQGLPGIALAGAAREGRFESEGWRLRKDGSRFWALAVLDAIRDDDGELLGFRQSSTSRTTIARWASPISRRPPSTMVSR
jgi:PAS domain S-box-containing protein